VAIIGNDKAVSVAVYAALVYDIISATNSSPQTTEINAKKRADSLMRWVHIGLAQAVGFAMLGAVLDPDIWPPILGASIAGGLMYAQYRYALEKGLESDEEGTETY
jgi:hypothetical protein